MSDIVIHNTVTSVTTEYTKYMFNVSKKLALEPEKLKFVCHCIDKESQSFPETISAKCVVASNEKLAGSYGHAVGIKSALSFIKDNEKNIHIIADGDTVPLIKGWDIALKTIFNSGIKIIGTTYEDVGGWSSGPGKGQTYKNIPNFSWAALAPGLPWWEVDVIPLKAQLLPISNQELSETFNLPIGYELLCDGGWQLPIFLKKYNAPFNAMTHIKANSPNALIVKGLEMYNEEYHLNGMPYVVHQRGSSTHRFRKHDLSIKFYNAVDAHVAKELGKTGYEWKNYI